MKLEDAIVIVISHLDEKMANEPSRELADVSNYLEKELAELRGKE